MSKLEYKFTNDVLFKMLFVKYPELLKRLIAKMLGIPLESIGKFKITNPDIPLEVVGEKFCRLDINMTVDGRRVDLEVQVTNEGDYPERALYYWARGFSSALGVGGEYSDLPPSIVISILAFKQFDCTEFYSEFQVLEVKRHTPLTDRMVLQFYELPKIPKEISSEDELGLWLTLFDAKTEADLAKLEAMEVPVMKQAIEAYYHVTATDEFREIERLRSRARHNEASALGHAQRKEREKWQGIVADKDAENNKLRAQLAELQAQLNETN